MRWQNPESPSDYVDAIASLAKRADDAMPLEEQFFVGLRLTDGIRPEPTNGSDSTSPSGAFSTGPARNATVRTLRLTDRGVCLSNEVFQEFLTT